MRYKRETKRLLTAILAAMMAFTLCPRISMQEVSAEKTEKDDYDMPVVLSLGDSYSSGEGVEPFYDQDDLYEVRNSEPSADFLAHRSKNSWSGLLEFDGEKLNESRNTNWFFIAASGAETTHIYTDTQKKEYTYRDYTDGKYKWTKDSTQLAVQLDVIKQYKLASRVDYVTLTIGGNDIGFSDIMKAAALQSDTLMHGWLRASLALAWVKYTAKGDFLEITYEMISSAVGPDATILVVGYSPLLSESEIEKNSVIFDNSEARLINKNVRKFNEKIEKIVQDLKEQGLNIEFVDVEGIFKGHEAYSAVPYINGVMAIQPYDINQKSIVSAYSMHPNGTEEALNDNKEISCGIEAYVAAVQEVIDELEPKRLKRLEEEKKETVSTTEDTTEKATEAATEETVDYTLYDSTIDQWLAHSEYSRYAIADLDGDGIDELITGTYSDYEVDGVFVGGIYSIKNGELIRVFSGDDHPYGVCFCYKDSMLRIVAWTPNGLCVTCGFLKYKNYQVDYEIGYFEGHLGENLYCKIADESALQKLYDQMCNGSYIGEGIVELINANPEKYEKISEQDMRDGVDAYQALDLEWYAEKKASESEVLTDANYEELYASIIEEYRQIWNGEKSTSDLGTSDEDYIKGMFGAEHGDNAAYYTIQDINGDGIKELYIHGTTDGDGPDALYTLDNQTPVFVYGGWSRNCYTIYDNGKIENGGSSGAADNTRQVYSFDGKKLILQFSVYGLYSEYYYDATGEYTSDEVHSIFYEKNPDPWSVVDMYWYQDTSLQLISYEESEQIFDDYFKDAHVVEFTGERYNLESGEVISLNETAAITEDDAYQGVYNYLAAGGYDFEALKDYGYLISEDWSDSLYKVTLRSYTGAFSYYYADKSTGYTYITEYVPGIIDEETENGESFYIQDYL